MLTSPCLLALPNESVEWLQLLLGTAIKGALLLLLAGTLVVLLKGASAAARHLLWSVAVASLLVLPVFELGLPNWHVPVFPTLLQKTAAETRTPIISQPSDNHSADVAEAGHSLAKADAALPLPATGKAAPRKSPLELSALPPPQTPLFDEAQREAGLVNETAKPAMNWALLIFIIWSAGFLAVLLRLFAGSLRVWMIARRAAPLTDSYWSGLLDELTAELRLSGKIALLKSRQVAMPMTWGAWRPVVLLPVDAEDWSEECCRIVLLHELAHIKRRDCLTQLLAQLACALHWFNPLVWSAANRLRVERELACDDQVLEVGTRASDYATHLVAIASSFESNRFASAATVGMACSQLESRIVSILNPQIRRRGLNRFAIIFVGVVAVFLVVPLSVVQPWVSRQEDLVSKDALSAATNRLQLPVEINGEVSEGAAPAKRSESGLSDLPSTPEEPQLWGAAEEGKNHNPAMSQQEPDIPLPNSDDNVAQTVDLLVVDAGVAEKPLPQAEGAGTTANPSGEQSQRLKLHGITPEFIESARRLGFENLSTHQLIQLRVHRIDEAFINQVRAWGFANASLNQLVQLRLSGMNGEYIDAMKGAGFDKLSLNKLANLKMHNVTPDYIEEMRRLGFDNLTADQLLSLKIHRVNEAFVRETQNWGYGKLSLNELLQIRVHNLTPNFAQEMKALGFENLSLQKLLQLKVHNMNGAYIREMQALGFENLTVEQALKMRLHHITGEYVKKLRAAGFKNISVNQLVDMKRHGIDDILLKHNR